MSDLPITENFHSNCDWRNSKPVWEKETCVKCGICYLFCPDSAVGVDEEGYYQAKLEYCKGCGVCSRQCPTGSIRMEEEVPRLPWQVR